jgi:hypothetical protein
MSGNGLVRLGHQPSLALYIVLRSVSSKCASYSLTILVCRLAEWRKACHFTIYMLKLLNIKIGIIYYYMWPSKSDSAPVRGDGYEPAVFEVQTQQS